MFTHSLTGFTLAAATLFPISSAATTPVPLRILPVGASVTFGVGSTTGNSYRKSLRDTLTQPPNNHSVNFVGRHRNGDFADNDVEATSGFVMTQIATAARSATPMLLPNLILIEAGTNDCNSGKPVPDAGANMTSLVQDLYKLSPDVTVVMATLLANKAAAQDGCRVDVNAQYARVADGFAAKGERFVLVDMRSEEGPTTADLADSRHPNDRGYAKMAAVWMKGIEEALERGFIGMPAENGIPLDGGAGAGGGRNGSVEGQGSVMGLTVTGSGTGMALGVGMLMLQVMLGILFLAL